MSAKMTGARASSAPVRTTRARHMLMLAGSVLLVAVFACSSAFAQVCDIGPDQCNTGMCVDGNCEAVPVQDGTPCTPDTPSSCETNYTCQGGVCTGTPTNDGNSCTPDSVCATTGYCASGTCFAVPDLSKNGMTCEFFPGSGLCYPGSCMDGQCIPGNIVNCPQTDPCMYNYCNPANGQCTSIAKCFPGNPCQGTTCTNGTCNNINEGGACDDFNVCTNPDTCHNGVCMGAIGGGPTPTFTPIVKPTATRTPTPTVLASAACVGDCNNDGQVGINEIVVAVNIYLGTADLSSCPNADQNGDKQVQINEVVQAVNSYLDAATCPKVAADTFNPGGE